MFKVSFILVLINVVVFVLANELEAGFISNKYLSNHVRILSKPVVLQMLRNATEIAIAEEKREHLELERINFQESVACCSIVCIGLIVLGILLATKTISISQ
eukprot:200527_1